MTRSISFTLNTEIGFMFWKLGLKFSSQLLRHKEKNSSFVRIKNEKCLLQILHSESGWVINIIFLPNDFLFKRQEGHLLLALLTLGPEGIASAASIPHCRTVVIKHFYNKINFIFYFISLLTKSWKKQNVSWRTNCERKRTNILRKGDQPTRIN